MPNILYSFAAKDIQNYILRSDKLVEMVGASELIDKLCREGGFLQNFIDMLGITKDKYEFITRAAGWAKIEFKSESDAATLYKYWPLVVSTFAPGLNIVQSLIPVNGSLSKAINESEKQLIYARNTLNVSLPEIGPLIHRNPRTGLAAVDVNKNDGDIVDRESIRKRQIKTNSLIQRMSEENDDATWPKELKHISGSERKYIAIIHADGNSLGSMLLKIQDYLAANPAADALSIYKGFSQAIEQATLKAVQHAYQNVILDDYEKKVAKAHAYKSARIIVLGGDDVTLITRADLAFKFTKEFLIKFEETAKIALKENLDHFKKLNLPKMLTACAGIAFVKQAYPFSRAYELAESLCKAAKIMAKSQMDLDQCIVPSCFSFCKISTSIAGDYQTIKEKELTSRDGTTKFWFGPYGVGTHSNNLPKYDDLESLSHALEQVPSGSIRELITTMYSNMTTAQNDYKRILQVLRRNEKNAGYADRLEVLLKALTGPSNDLVSVDNRTPILDAHRHGELQK